MRLCLIDLETTGLDPRPAPEGDGAEVCELAFIDIDEHGNELDRFQILVRPFGTIPAPARAVHHIAPDDLLGAPRFVQTKFHLRFKPLPDVFVAHNTSFEKSFLTEIWPDEKWLCTMKAALRVWPEAPAFSNSVLRYWLDLDVPVNPYMPAHRALMDCVVTSKILFRLLKEAALDEMISWERQPAMFPRVMFGKHRGSGWADVPVDYLQWIVETITDKEDVRFCAAKELERRTETFKREIQDETTTM